MARKVEINGIIGVILNGSERIALNFGDICDQCNDNIKDDCYYIPVLNMEMCMSCGDKYLNSHHIMDEDKRYQEKNFNNIKTYINIM